MSLAKWLIFPILLLFLISCAHSTPSVTDSGSPDSKTVQTKKKSRMVKEG
jgi:hypothetical protein